MWLKKLGVRGKISPKKRGRHDRKRIELNWGRKKISDICLWEKSLMISKQNCRFVNNNSVSHRKQPFWSVQAIISNYLIFYLKLTKLASFVDYLLFFHTLKYVNDLTNNFLRKELLWTEYKKKRCFLLYLHSWKKCK